jgi:hypothetical protein
MAIAVGLSVAIVLYSVARSARWVFVRHALMPPAPSILCIRRSIRPSRPMPTLRVLCSWAASESVVQSYPSLTVLQLALPSNE